MKNEKNKITVIVSMMALIILVGGATFAFFQAQTDSGKSVDINVYAKTVDLLTFETGDVIEFDLTRENFGEGKGNVTTKTFAQANLIANNVTNEATANYYLYILVSTNEFKYTLLNKNPEIILQVTDPEGNEITSINGVNYVETTQADGTIVKGFDITTYKGLLQITDAYEISSSSSEEYTHQKWDVQVVFVNYDDDQTENTNKSLHAKVIIQSSQMETPTIADICNTGENLNNCIMGLNGYVSTLYHHDGSYRDENDNILDANDDSFRFAGSSKNVKNYVCFGSEALICPDDNLYRIIGVFTETEHGLTGQRLVKLIKMNSYSSYLNQYASYTTFNTTYLATIPEEYQNKIANAKWIYKSSFQLNFNPHNIFLKEIINYEKLYEPTDGVTKMGGTYLSDYAYSAPVEAWSTLINAYSNHVGVNWMFMKGSEYVPSQYLGYSYGNYIETNGNASYTSTAGNKKSARVNLYLNSDVKFVSGTGEKEDPIRIS